MSMDISLYFNPIDFELFEQAGKFHKNSLGYQVRKDTLKYLEARKGGIRVAIFGVPHETDPVNKGTSKAPDQIRKHLYRLSNLEGFRGIVDLGNLKKGKTGQDIQFALRDVVEFLSDNGITAVILGGSQDISIGVARAFRDVKDFTLTVVDSVVNVKTGIQATRSSNFISRILNENPELSHLQMIGIQSHLVSPATLEMLREQTFDYIHLGPLRDEFKDVEPKLRNTHFLSFDISSVRQSDARTGFQLSSSGLYGEEACRISHYAGLSNKIRVFGLFEVNPDKDSGEVTLDLSAQIIWYFLEALSHRSLADPVHDQDAFNRYFTELEGHTIVFYKHLSTGRWWIDISNPGKESWLIPCREKDYLLAMKEEIPDVWWKFARKTDKFSK
jgi:arginase family enzyme